MSRIKVAAVSYLNTKLFVYGLEHSPLLSQIELSVNPPSVIAEQLLRDEVDLGLVPVRVIPSLNEAHIISDFGISCDGAVGSVVICSSVPIESVEKLYLDYQSRTSAALARLLIHDYWKRHPDIAQSAPGFEEQIKGTTAGLLIGDRALHLKSRFEFCYDLGEAWKRHTGRPFVFACWVANKKLPAAFIAQFNDAMRAGVTNLPAVIQEQQPAYPDVDVKDYLTNRISFVMDEAKRNALRFFLASVPRGELTAAG
jgi:chorismate dehydratase